MEKIPVKHRVFSDRVILVSLPAFNWAVSRGDILPLSDCKDDSLKKAEWVFRGFYS